MEVGNMEKSNDVKLSEVSNFMTFEPMHLNVLPKKQNKKIAVLNMIATLFDENKKYSEVEVNEILKPVYDDFVLLRRYLIDYKFLTREKDGSCYYVNKIPY